jgi:hypothetical protein
VEAASQDAPALLLERFEPVQPQELRRMTPQ